MHECITVAWWPYSYILFLPATLRVNFFNSLYLKYNQVMLNGIWKLEHDVSHRVLHRPHKILSGTPCYEWVGHVIVEKYNIM